MSFAESPTLSQQYWWVARVLPFEFVLTKQGRWIRVVGTPIPDDYVHLKDRYVDLARITSNKAKS